MGGLLGSRSDRDAVTNVCIFICDSLREDRLPAWIARRGVAASAVAPSTFTGASVPAIFSGRYPHNHGCFRFDDRLPGPPPLLQGTHAYRATSIWTHLAPAEKPPIRQTHATAEPSLEALEPPFVYVEHDKGGHSPYGHSFEESTTPSFFADVDDPSRLPAMYDRSIRRSAERFRAVLDRLEDRRLLDETLVVFTSDHGELLGEPRYGGLYGHGRPMVPEVVRVPTVFLGAGLPEGDALNPPLSGIDIAPTALGARGSALVDVDGVDLWNETPPQRALLSEFWQRNRIGGREFDVYRASGTWLADGGIVHHHGPRTTRLLYGVYNHLRYDAEAPVVRAQMTPRRFGNLVRLYASTRCEYGDVDGLEADAVANDDPFDRAVEAADGDDGTERHYSDEQLRALGYLE